MRTAYCFLILCHLLSCTDNAENASTERANGYTPELKNREDSLLHDVLQGHDVAMAKMSKLSRHLERVQALIDSMDRRGISAQQAQAYHQWTDLRESLRSAEYGMNAWMEEFKLDSFQSDREKRIRYLEGEKIKVMRVKENILGSLATADSLILLK